MTKTKKILWVFFALFALFVAGRLYYRITDDFRMGNITHDFKDDTGWETQTLSHDEQTKLGKIIDQKYTYLGKGAQSYAFASEDQNYVIKLFKFKHLRPTFWSTLLPNIDLFKEFKENEAERKGAKLRSVLSGYHLAYHEQKEGSGLIYLHFTPTHYFPKKVLFVDKIGMKHYLDLDQIVFILQKKGLTFRDYLGNLINKGDIEGSKAAIGKIIDMYVHEYKSGTWDRDHGVMHNTGFVKGDQPFHLDIGKFSKDDKMKNPEIYKEDLKHISWKIDTWIKNHHPESYPALSEHIEKLYRANTGEALNVDKIDPKPYLKNKKVSWFFF